MKVILYECIGFFVFSYISHRSDASKRSNPPACDDLQRCLNRESRECWKKFYNEARKGDDLMGDLLKACPENEFMDVVDRTEADLWPDYVSMDKNLTECMLTAGFKIRQDFCGNMRSISYSEDMERTAQATKKETKSNNDNIDKCWINAMKTCINQYPPPNEKIDNALSSCESDKKMAREEERLGFEVGKRVVLNILTKLKEAFQKEDGVSEDDLESIPKNPTTRKPTSRHQQKATRSLNNVS